MITYINEEILILKEKLRKYNKLETLKKSKTEELEEKKLQKIELKNILEKERKDVEKLESLSLTNIFSTLTGNKYEKLDKEEEEYLLAKLKYEDSKKEIDKLEEELVNITSQLVDYGDIKNRYNELINKKEKLLIKEGGRLGVELKNSIIYIDEIHIDIKEVKEAIDSGQITLDALKEVREKLKSAKSWGVWDILGGGIISDIGKHSAIEKANKIAKEVQYNLKTFKKELSDVNEFTDIQVNLSSFASFADFFFDGIFADWFVQTKINNSLENVNSTISKIEEIIAYLNKNLINLEDELEKEKVKSREILDL